MSNRIIAAKEQFLKANCDCNTSTIETYIMFVVEFYRANYAGDIGDIEVEIFLLKLAELLELTDTASRIKAIFKELTVEYSHLNGMPIHSHLIAVWLRMKQLWIGKVTITATPDGRIPLINGSPDIHTPLKQVYMETAAPFSSESFAGWEFQLSLLMLFVLATYKDY